MKPVTFDAYLKWYDSHNVVVKSETVGKKLLPKDTTAVNTLEKGKAVMTNAAVTVLNNNMVNRSNTAKKVVPHANQKKVAQIEGEGKFEDVKMEVEDEELDGEWEKVGGAEDEDGEWDFV